MFPLPRLLRITSIGSRTLRTTITGSAGPLKNITQKFAFPRCTLRPGMTFSLVVRCTTLSVFGVKEHAATEEARKGQRLLVVIGGHAGEGRKIGEVDFGVEAERVNEDEITLRWYDFLFKGVENELRPASLSGFL